MEKLKAVRKLTTGTKRRFFGIVTVAIIIIAAIGAGYYFRFKGNQSHFKKYGLEILDSYHIRIERQLNHEILAILSKDYMEIDGKSCKIEWDSNYRIQDSDCFSKEDITDRAVESLFKKIDLENGFLNKPFKEFVIAVAPKGKDSVGGKSIKTENSLFLGQGFEYDKILKKDSLNNGLVKTYSASGADYLLFGRKYQFKYASDPTFKCEIALLGLVDGKAYNKITRELDPWVIAMLVTFLLISLFGLPFFKMIFITAEERVFSRDVIGAGFALVVGGAMVVVIFMSLVQYGYKYHVTLKHELEDMGHTIRQRFEEENKENVKALHKFDLSEYNPLEFDSIKAADSDLLSHFKFVITIDESGVIKKKINLIRRPEGFPTNIKDRQYVKDFKEKKNIWTYLPEEGKGIDYVMQPVVAMESGEEEAVYIMDHEKPDGETDDEGVYKVASAQLASIHLPVMPFGFQYAVIDNSKNGDVWFHSQPGKSSLEEFFKVSRNANDLRAAIYGRVEANGRLNYHDSKFLYFITPIPDTNLNVVVLYDLALLRLGTSEVLSITAMAITVVFGLVGLICLLTVILRGRRTRLYKEEQFIFDFLTPKDNYKSRYLFLTLSFAILTPLYVAFGLLKNFNPVPAFFGSLLAVVWTYILVYYVLYPSGRTSFKFYVHNTLFLFAVIALNTAIWFVRTEEIPVYHLSLILQGVCLALIILSQYVFTHGKGIRQPDLEGKVGAFNDREPKNIRELVQSWSNKFPFSLERTYSLFLLSWFLAAAIVPTIMIYLKTEKFNDSIWRKTDQIYMTRAYLGKQKKIEKIIPRISQDYLNEKYNAVYEKHLSQGKYLTNKYSLGNQRSNPPEQKESFAKAGYLDKLLWSTRPIFNEKVRNYKGMVYQSASDWSWSSKDTLETIELTTLNTYKRRDTIVSKWLENTTLDENGKKNKAHYFLPLAWFIGIFVLSVALYSLIYFYTNRFYGFRFRYLKPINFDTDKKIDYVGKFGKIMGFEDSNSGLLLIGPPFSGKRRFAERIISTCEEISHTNEPTEQASAKELNERAYISFLKLDNAKKGEEIEVILNSLSQNPLFVKHEGEWDDKQWEHAKYFIIEHLEHGLKSFELNKVKLKVLSFLIAHKKRVVITSEVYPNQMLAIYKPFLEGETYEDENFHISDHNSWRNIFGAFPQILVGMTDQKEQVDKLLKGMKIKGREKTAEEIKGEVGYSQFLPKLAPIMMAKYTDIRFDEQSMVLHVQKLSHGYYTDIWNSLPARERYMLYDLAKDGFMNIKNGNSLFSLIKKGLIVWHNRPVIFNESFQNFILAFVSKAEALQLEMRNRKEGSWATIKIVMYLLIITLVVFILLGEPGLLEDFEELVAALGGLGVILPLISSILGRSGEK